MYSKHSLILMVTDRYQLGIRVSYVFLVVVGGGGARCIPTCTLLQYVYVYVCMCVRAKVTIENMREREICKCVSLSMAIVNSECLWL